MTQTPTPLREWQGHIAMLCFAILVAGSFSLGSLMANSIDPIAFTAVRFALATCIMGSIALVRVGITGADLSAPWRYFAMGIPMAAYFVLMFEGLKTANPVSMAAVFTLTPIFSGIIGYLMLRQIMSGRIALCLLIGAIGALWVIFRADLSAFLGFDVGRGELIFVAGCMCHAIYPPLIRKLNKGEHPLVFTFGMLAAGTLTLFLVGAPKLIATDWSMAPKIVWITLLYTTIFATATTFFLVQYASMRLPASKVMAYTYLTPSVVLLWEGALGKSWPNAWVLVGLALCILSLLGLLKSGARDQGFKERA